jgi:hypothetical protein
VLRLFAGYDRLEAIGWHVFCQSVLAHTSDLVSITPLSGPQRDGSNAFTYSRFLVPHLANFRGTAIFADGADMLLRTDLRELWDLRDPFFAVQVVRHDYRTKHARKYIGTAMETDNRDYPRKNWSSLVIWNCGHYAHRALTPEFVATQNGAFLHRFGWLEDKQIGALPAEWNHLVGEQPYDRDANLVHFTLGIPAFEHYASADYADEWRSAAGGILRGARS